MTKLKIYIDFEAISSPFNREIKISRDFPYAYSIGLFVGKKFKSKTFVFNFNKDNIDNIDQILRVNILKDIRELTNKKNFLVNKDTVTFISYAPALERKILSKVYRGVSVKDISEGAMISIAQATEEYISKENYFEYLKSYVAINVSGTFIEKRGLNNDGALASIAGYYLYLKAFNLNGKFAKEDINTRVLVKELARYSKDDVIRMKFIENNRNDFLKKAKVRKQNILKRNKINSEIRKLDNTIENLKCEDQKLTIEKFIKKIKTKRKKLNTKIQDLEIENSNFYFFIQIRIFLIQNVIFDILSLFIKKYS